MITYNKNNIEKFETIPVDTFWNIGDEAEQKMHRIHSYPAKFPAFITTKAIEHAKRCGLKPKRIADLFCGCGTVSYEAKRNNIDFWGCDLNPVATLIAKVKSKKYQAKRLERYFEHILKSYNRTDTKDNYNKANTRLKYWYTRKQYNELYQLKASINKTLPKDSEYKLFFLCAFSNILKPTSRWLTKSIKPQIDPYKKRIKVFNAFSEQFHSMLKANIEAETETDTDTETTIITNNVLDLEMKKPKVDLIITSPPYVTSYEYADLHQLSSMWLDYADDYRDLREGSIGGLYHTYNFEKNLKKLNTTASNIVFKLLNKQHNRAKSIAKYYLDMQEIACECFKMLRKNGMALFVIGNTEYKDIRIENAQHLAESLKEAGFSKIKITKRKISHKFLTPYRDKNGRFTKDSTGKKIYSEEFIIIGRK